MSLLLDKRCIFCDDDYQITIHKKDKTNTTTYYHYYFIMKTIHTFLLLTLCSFLSQGNAFKAHEPFIQKQQKSALKTSVDFRNQKEQVHVTDLVATPRRGGGVLGGLTKSKVVEFHGYMAQFFGLMFILESFGISLPLMGPAAVMGGLNLDDAALVFVLRFAGTIAAGLGMMEVTFNTGEATKIFTNYHILAVIMSAISAKVRSIIDGDLMLCHIVFLNLVFVVAHADIYDNTLSFL